MKRWILMLVLGVVPAFAQTAPLSADVVALRDAAQDLASGNLATAETKLQAILKEHPDEPRALDLLGIVRAQQHRDEEAEQVFQKVIAQAPQIASAHVNLGLLYAQTSREEQAIAQFHEALRIEPGRTDAVQALTGVLRRQARAVAASDPEKALAALMDARKVAPQDPDVLYDFGMVALHMNLDKDAAEAFRGSLAARADDPAALYGLARAQMAMTQYQDAHETFRKYLALKPNDASAHFADGVTLAVMQSPDEARREFAESIRLQPVQTESYFQIGLLDIDAKQLDAAAENLNRVLARDAHHAGALGAMGRVEFERKNYEKATQYLQQSIAARYEQRQAHYYLGMTLARMGKQEESAKELQIASDIEHAEIEKQRTGVHIVNGPQ